MGIDELIQKIQTYHPESDEMLIRAAYAVAKEAHEGQKRNSGEPYIIHPLNVAMILADLNMDDATICAGLLHDVLEDTTISEADMQKRFGAEITTLVDGVTKLKQIQSKSKVENQVDNYRKMVMAMANDIRVIIIKLADRLHNLRTLDYKDRVKQIEKATETIEIYVPIAHRLGIYTIKSELEDLCLKYLDPLAYREIAELVAKKLSEREVYIQEITSALEEKLDELKLNYRITGRPKTLYSIYKKMYKQNKNFDQIFDVTAIRVLVDTVKDCYSVLGIVHTLWKPIPKRFKDYVAMPKPNMYQSLHTTVIGPEGETFEVQIRTWEMHETAEYGIAAHWRYKEGKVKTSAFDEKLNWVRQLKDWQTSTTDSKEFMETLKGDFFSDEVYVFSPNGDVIELPKGSTPVDFAYRIHTAVGNKCTGAKVDGRLVPLDHELENGNIVEILTSKNATGPSRDWLGMVKSSHARNKIRQYFKQANREENVITGKDMIERDLRKDGFRTAEVMTEENLEKLVSRMSFSQAEDLYAAVGYGSVTLGAVTGKLKELYREKKRREEEELLLKEALEEPKSHPVSAQASDHSSVRIKGEGIENLQVKFARCCSPVPGDAIIGFITKGRGISIHRKNCVNVKNTEATERLIDVEWNRTKDMGFYVSLGVTGYDKSGYLAHLAEMISKLGLNLASISAKSNQDGTARIALTVNISDVEEVARLMGKIRKMKGTIEVYRIKN